MRKLISCVVVLLACGFALGQAQEKVLYNFAGSPDGAGPVSKLLLDPDGNLFGTTRNGGDVATFPCFGTCGTVFELSPAEGGGWTESVVYDFCQDFDGVICLDGENPVAGITSDSAGNLYGTTSSGGGDNCPYGGGGCGTVFELSPPTVPGGAWAYTLLYQFCQLPGDDVCSDGASPYGKLTFDSAGNLYGTTSKGGKNGGVVFELSPSPDRWTQKVLYTFCGAGKWPVCPDGSTPEAGVSFDQAGNIYGSTSAGGSPKYAGLGIVFKLSLGPDGWKESVLNSFNTYGRGAVLMGAVNIDSAGNLYSTAFQGGQSNKGVVFQLSPKNGGTERTFLFSGTDGANPTAGVLIDPRSGTLYGTTSQGGINNSTGGCGTVFKIDGKGESVLYSFFGAPDSDGAQPMAALIADKKGHLYGTTKAGGVNNQGTVFEIIP
jgi:uncharacterized repeat protein (TIGR03803 family)